MQQDYLVFQLYAPFASWGEQAVGQERPTADHPSRSALLGLLGAALGIARDQEAQLQALRDACHFGVKLLAPGLVMRDFHTIQMPPDNKKVRHLHTRRDELRADKLGTLLSFRSYRQDSVAVVAVWLRAESAYSLAQLAEALEQPHFQLYLGRKSCPPALPLKPEVLAAASLKAALDGYCVCDALAPLLDETGACRYYWEQTPELVSGMAQAKTYTVTRYDQPLNRARWQFVSRDEQVYLQAGGEHYVSQ